MQPAAGSVTSAHPSPVAIQVASTHRRGSIHARRCQAVSASGHFRTGQVALKCLCLAIVRVAREDGAQRGKRYLQFVLAAGLIHGQHLRTEAEASRE